MRPANLHVTTIGHGYAAREHVDHNRMFGNLFILCILTELLVVMNLSHVITEFSFGPYFPEITQPLDNSFELAHDRKLPVQIGLLLWADSCP